MEILTFPVPKQIVFFLNILFEAIYSVTQRQMELWTILRTVVRHMTAIIIGGQYLLSLTEKKCLLS